MATNPELERVPFEHLVMEGTPYEIGAFQGEAIKRHQGSVDFLAQLDLIPSEAQQAIHQILGLYYHYSPGLLEEVTGCADSLQVSLDQLIYYAMTYPRAGQCCQIAVLPSMTRDYHTLTARNYDFYPRQNPTRLCTTRAKGKYAHIGFSCMLFDRVDGLNEKGLSLTMTEAGPGNSSEDYVDLFYRRTILDLCQTVDEALEFLDDLPNFCTSNMLIADKEGNAALIEMGLDGQRAVQTINRRTEEQTLFTTNYYTIPWMFAYFPVIDENSLIRSITIAEWIEEHAPEITVKGLMELLSADMPEGTFNSTLWGAVFDLTDLKAHIRFGAPELNPWKEFRLDDPVGITEYDIPYRY